MRKFSILSLALIAVLSLAGCGKPKATTPAPAQTNAPLVTETAVTQEENFNGTLEQLMAQGKAVSCHSVSESEGTKMEGDFYIDNKGARTRSNTTVTAKNSPSQKSMMIMDKDYVYMWTVGEKTGFKYPVLKDEPVADNQTTDSQVPETRQDLRNEKFDFKCKAWQVDETMFAVPTDIKFSDPMADLKKTKTPAGPSQAEIQKMINDAQKAR